MVIPLCRENSKLGGGASEVGSGARWVNGWVGGWVSRGSVPCGWVALMFFVVVVVVVLKWWWWW